MTRAARSTFSRTTEVTRIAFEDSGETSAAPEQNFDDSDSTALEAYLTPYGIGTSHALASARSSSEAQVRSGVATRKKAGVFYK